MPNTYACKLVFPIQMFQYISAEGLHFSAFHLFGSGEDIYYLNCMENFIGENIFIYF